MRTPLLALATTVAAIGLATTAPAQDRTPTTTTTPPTTTTTPAADDTPPVISIVLPSSRVGKRITALTVRARDTGSSVQFLAVNVDRTITSHGRRLHEAFDGSKWFATRSSTKYRHYPPIGGTTATYTARFRKGLSAGSYVVTVQAQNDPGKTSRRTFRFVAH